MPKKVLCEMGYRSDSIAVSLRAKIWEGDELSKSQFSESGDSLNGQTLFRIAFPVSFLPKPSSTECLARIQ